MATETGITFKTALLRVPQEDYRQKSVKEMAPALRHRGLIHDSLNAGVTLIYEACKQAPEQGNTKKFRVSVSDDFTGGVLSRDDVASEIRKWVELDHNVKHKDGPRLALVYFSWGEKPEERYIEFEAGNLPSDLR